MMKKHVVDELKSVGMSGAEAKHAFDTVTTAMANMVRRGERVRIPGIGTLVKRRRAETRKKNPRTGEYMVISSCDIVALRKAEKF